jgi:hypothetical protein
MPAPCGGAATKLERTWFICNSNIVYGTDFIISSSSSNGTRANLSRVPWNFDAGRTGRSRRNVPTWMILAPSPADFHETDSYDGICATDARPRCDRSPSSAMRSSSLSRGVRRRDESGEQGLGRARHDGRLDAVLNADAAMVVDAGETGARGRNEGRRALIAPQLGRWSHSTFGMHPRGGGWGRYTAHHLAACWSRRRSR